MFYYCILFFIKKWTFWNMYNILFFSSNYKCYFAITYDSFEQFMSKFRPLFYISCYKLGERIDLSVFIDKVDFFDMFAFLHFLESTCNIRIYLNAVWKKGSKKRVKWLCMFMYNVCTSIILTSNLLYRHTAMLYRYTIIHICT